MNSIKNTLARCKIVHYLLLVDEFNLCLKIEGILNLFSKIEWVLNLCSKIEWILI